MSQTETILLIVLGFSLASLIALFLVRFLWAAAVRVGARRMQRQVPSSLVGLQTERDRLRAEYAMLSQRLGARLETAKLQMAEHMAEVSRHRNRIHEIESAESARTEEIRSLTARVKELDQALAEARAREEDLRRSLATQEEELQQLRKKRKAPKAEKTEKAPRPAATRKPAAAAAAAPPPSDDPEERLRQRIERLTELAKAQPDDEQVLVTPPPRPEDPLVAEKLAEAERQTEDLTRDLEKLDAEWQGRLATTTPQVADSEADANVISLSNRIRDLKKSLGSSP